MRALGHEVEVWEIAAGPSSNPADRVVDLGKADARTILDLFADALQADFDVLDFHFAESLFPLRFGLPWFWDLPIWKALGKKVVMTFHGTDARITSQHIAGDPWSYHRFAHEASDHEPLIPQRMAIIRTYADQLIVNGVPGLEFVPDAVYVPRHLDVDAYSMVGPRRDKRPLVVHAPSRRSTKGTLFVTEVMALLRDRGLAFDFRMPHERLSHDDFIALYQDADLVIDNPLMGDIEMSTLESMALGKPVVTRIKPEVEAAHPDCPAVSADPDQLASRLVPLLTDPNVRKRLGEQGRAYVTRTHDARVVVRQLLDIYRQPVRRIGRTFPDWAGSNAPRTVEAREETIRRLELRVAELKHLARQRGREAGRLRQQVRRYERILRITHLRRVLRGLEPLRTWRRRTADSPTRPDTIGQR